MGAGCQGRSIFRRSLPPCPPPTRRGRKKVCGFAAFFDFPARRGRGTREGGRAGLEPAPTVFGIRFHSSRTGRISAPRAAASRRLRSETRLRAQAHSGPRCRFRIASDERRRGRRLGDPRFDDLRRWLTGITFHIFRRGGPMCPPVRGCVTGTGPIKRYMPVNEKGPLWAAARTAMIGTCQSSIGGSPGTATPTAGKNRRPHPAHRCARAPLPEGGAKEVAISERFR